MSTHRLDPTRFDYDEPHIRRARSMQGEAVGGLAAAGLAVAVRPLRSGLVRMGAFATALAVAAGLFWATMLIAPPVATADDAAGLDVSTLNARAPLDLPILEADAN